MPNKLYVLLIYVILAMATFIAFEPMRHNGFVDYDDNKYITKNPNVQAGLARESVVWAFTTLHASNWHPLTWLSHMLDCQLFGLKPLRHHLTSCLLHIANTLLLFWVLKKTTGSLWPSAFVAAAFALHPLHVESVAWISERKDVLSTLFWLLTIAAYVRYAERPGIGRYLPVCLFLTLGLMAKPMLVTLPFVLLLLDYWPLARFQREKPEVRKPLRLSDSTDTGYQRSSAWRLLAEKIPLFLLVAASAAVTFIAQQSGKSVMPAEQLPLNFRIANALVSYISYIAKMICPSRLAVLYPVRSDILSPIVTLSILVIVSTAVIYLGRRRRYPIVGWFWYLGVLVPVIGLVQVGNQSMADRYTYLPSIGIFIIVAWGAYELLVKWRYRNIALGISAGIVLAGLLLCTRIQVRHWRNSLTLFAHTLAVTENNYVIHNNYAVVLVRAGRTKEGISHFRQALTINPNHHKARNNLGKTLLGQGMIDQAIERFSELLHAGKAFYDTYYYLGQAYVRKGQFNLAIKNYKQALRLKPDWPEVYNNLGVAYNRQGKYELAIQNYNEALRLKPDWPKVYNNLGVAYNRQGKYELAIQNYNEALRLKPDYPSARKNLALSLKKQAEINEAIKKREKTP